MKIPTREQAIALLKKYNTMPNILEHLIQVNKVAILMAQKLKQTGENINVDVVSMAALLHDIAKSRTIIEKKEDRHHIEAEEILIEEGYPELGHICKKHALQEIKNLNNWEEKIVNYADLRVKHDKIVSIKERIDDLTKRYDIPEEQRLTYDDLLPLEKEIFLKLDFKPEQVKELIENEKHTK